MKMLLKELRVHQWSKNALLFVPAIASHRILEIDVLVNSVVAFFSFSFLASSLYVLNDFGDLHDDREHPYKRLRPLASGKLSIPVVVIALLVLLTLGFYFAISLGGLFLVAAVAYVVLNISYSFYMKKILVLDVVCLMIFYLLRLIAGGIPNNISLSPWLLSFALFLFFSLGLLKRYVDMITAISNNSLQIKGRGYLSSDSEVIRSLGISSGLISTLVLILYTSSDTVTYLYAEPMILTLITPGFLYWISRLWVLAGRGVISNDPVSFAMKDHITYMIAALTLTIMWIARQGSTSNWLVNS